VTEGPDLVSGSDGNGIPDSAAIPVDPVTGQPLNEVFPGASIQRGAGGFAGGLAARIKLFSDPVDLG